MFSVIGGKGSQKAGLHVPRTLPEVLFSPLRRGSSMNYRAADTAVTENHFPVLRAPSKYIATKSSICSMLNLQLAVESQRSCDYLENGASPGWWDSEFVGKCHC